MKSIIISAILSILFLTAAMAQPTFGPSARTGDQAIVGKITGTLIDSVTGNPIAFATIALSKSGDNKSINGALTDENGSFKLEEVKTGSYKLNITFVGYQSMVIDPLVLSLNKPDSKLGKVVMRPNKNMLKQVEVSGEAALIENRADKLVYNAEKDIGSVGGDASDILRKVPMVTVDLDGNLQLRGSSNVKVLINGKPSGMMSGSIADALRIIPADQIKSVEVITNPSAKYDAEGTAGIINIITKKKDIAGTNGSINMGVGTRRNNLNGNLSSRRGRFGVNSSIGGHWGWPQIAKTTFIRTDSVGEDVRTLEQIGESEAFRLSGNAQLGFDYDINKYNTLSSNIRLNRFKFYRDGFVNSTLTDSSVMNYRRTTNDLNNNKGYDWSTDYRKTFIKPGQELGFSVQLSQDFRDNINDYELDNPASKEKSLNESVNRELTGQIDYTHPVNLALTIETGVKSIQRNIKSDYSYEVYDFSLAEYSNDASRSNVFDYNQNVYAGYMSFGYNFLKSFNLKLGSRLEHTVIDGDFSSSATKINNDYTNLIPSAVLSKTLKNFKTIKVAYNRRIQRPSLFYLNPYTNSSDPKNITYGNPSLTAEIADNFELGYSSFVKGISINTSVFYRHTDGVIESVLTIDSSGVSNTTFQNIAINDAIGLNIFGSVTLFKKLTLRGNLNVYNEYISSTKTTQTNDGTSYNGNIMGSYSLPKSYSIEVFSMLNSPRRTLQGINPSFSMLNIAAKKEFWKKKASLGIFFSNPFTRDRIFLSQLSGPGFSQESRYVVPFRTVGLNFSYQFGKMDFNQGPPKKKKGINNDDLKQEGGE